MKRSFSTVKGKQLAASLLVGLCAGLLIIVWFNRHVLPLIADYAAASVENSVNRTINTVVDNDIADGTISYDKMVSLTLDEGGKVAALTANMAEANLLRADIIQQLLDEFKQPEIYNLTVPLGNLLGSPLASGLGPKIPVKVVSVGAVDAQFVNDFSSSGINQTRHQIRLEVSVKVSILLPGKTTAVQVQTVVSVADTILMGEVPSSYTYFSNYESVADAAEDYYNYG